MPIADALDESTCRHVVALSSDHLMNDVRHEHAHAIIFYRGRGPVDAADVLCTIHGEVCAHNHPRRGRSASNKTAAMPGDIDHHRRRPITYLASRGLATQYAPSPISWAGAAHYLALMLTA